MVHQAGDNLSQALGQALVAMGLPPVQRCQGWRGRSVLLVLENACSFHKAKESDGTGALSCPFPPKQANLPGQPPLT